MVHTQVSDRSPLHPRALRTANLTLGCEFIVANVRNRTLVRYRTLSAVGRYGDVMVSEIDPGTNAPVARYRKYLCEMGIEPYPLAIGWHPDCVALDPLDCADGFPGCMPFSNPEFEKRVAAMMGPQPISHPVLPSDRC